MMNSNVSICNFQCNFTIKDAIFSLASAWNSGLSKYIDKTKARGKLCPVPCAKCFRTERIREHMWSRKNY